MKNIITVLLFFSVLSIFSQKKCDSDREIVIDVNTINKCKVEKEVVKTKKTKHVITSNTRYLKKRVYLNKVVHLASNLKTKTITDVKNTNKIDSDLLIVLKKESEKSIISFNSVEKIPMFASCNENSLENTTCFNSQMEQHIINNFLYPKEALRKGVEGDLEVSFVINKKGKVKDIKVIGAEDNDVLKEEAIRIVLLLPEFIPGKEKGNLVNVLYKFPMSFTLN